MIDIKYISLRGELAIENLSELFEQLVCYDIFLFSFIIELPACLYNKNSSFLLVFLNQQGETNLI